jgi:UDP-glucose:(heptosyl)LPS alpha-1,3-glucosyltransferase
VDLLKGLRLAIVCREAAGFGGTTTTIIEHARRLAALGCEVDVYGWKLDERRLMDAGAQPVRVPGLAFGGTFKRKIFAWLADRATARGYGLVHGHGDNLNQDVLSLHNCVHAAHEAVHGTPVDGSRGVAFVHAQQLRARRFKTLIANSELMKREVVSRFDVPAAAVEVIHPGYDPKRFSAADRARLRPSARRELGFSDGDVAVGLITSGDFKKRGVEEFIAALGRLTTPVKAVVIGKEGKLGPYRERARGLKSELRFVEPSSDVARFYHALDIYVHPAHYEEFGQSVQEALACGLPVVTTGSVGAAELLPREARETVLEKLDVAALARMIDRLASDAGLRQRLAVLGPSAVSRNTWDANFEATARVYRGVLAARRPQ